MSLYGIVGVGGFGREIMPLVANALQKERPHANDELVFVDENNHGSFVNNYLVMSIDEFFSSPVPDKYFNVAVANYNNRKKLAEIMIDKGAAPFNICAANSINLGNNNIADGAIWCPFTTLTTNATIGKFFHANIYSYVAHDCIIGDYVTFAPNVHCNGGVIIEDYAYIGTGAIIRQGTPDKPIIIGKGAIVGMGAVVTKSISPYETVVGNPARLLNRNRMLSLSTANS